MELEYLVELVTSSCAHSYQAEFQLAILPLGWPSILQDLAEDPQFDTELWFHKDSSSFVKIPPGERPESWMTSLMSSVTHHVSPVHSLLLSMLVFSSHLGNLGCEM